ncbi:TRAP transporter large permease [Pollutimonas bauzanensis]|uniref:TRAP transporter large permease protein n=1 Tax=Pollutimonas bauzanensis TaxID=658167 RepID=A0A1M5QFI7_9BURK|nr:TRAP transporter large permease [Pollutimonas bauzanensis]SHH12984.1 TRAP transporter, DctM subunit [Pollutimonas bauzanensis]
MTGIEVGLLAIVLLLVAIYIGMHIGIALILTALVGVGLLRDPWVAMRMASAAANDSIREYLFGVVPLFVLMGLLVSVSGIGRDIFDVFEWLFRRVRGGLGVSTIGANAVFSAITGISIASASVFAKVAVPEMIRHGYTPMYATGAVAGSSVLGMLIPPSLLMIIYGVLAEESIGRMFLAGVIPGIVLALAFCLATIAMARFTPDFMFVRNHQKLVHSDETWLSATAKSLPIGGLILLVLGGLYGGLFTPTEAGAVGALGALVIALGRRRLDLPKFWQVLVETGHVSVSVLFLIIAASFYSRMLAMTGLPGGLTLMLQEWELGPYGFLFAYVLITLALGCIIDSVSIMLIMLPIALPIVRAFEMDLIWFGVITVVAIEVGLITPPFGISVYTVRSALGKTAAVNIRQIFIGCIPFILCMLVLIALLIVFPNWSTWLARL